MSVYSTALQPHGRYHVTTHAGMQEDSAVTFMEYNARRYMGQFLAVISEERSVGYDASKLQG